MRLLSPGVLVLACAGLLAGSGAARAQNAKLELKPNPAATEFWIRTTERSRRQGFVTTPEAGADDWLVVDTLELVRQTSKPGEAGFIEVTVEPLGKSVRINEHKVDVEDPRLPLFYRISTRNELPDAMVLGDIAGGLAPQFPEKEIPVGHTWTAKIAATEQFMFPFEVKHTFTGIEDFQGEKVASILTEGQLVTKDADVAFNLSVAGNTKVGLTSGMVLHSQSTIVFNVQAVKRFKDGHKVQKKTVTRMVERRLPGDQQGPGR